MSGLDPSPRAAEMLARLRAFIAEHVAPNEALYYRQRDEGDRWSEVPLLADLKRLAREAGLWNLFLPDSRHGAGLSNLDYSPLCEEMGRIYWSPAVFNCGAPDTGNMETLERFGTDAQKRRWLDPLLAGEIHSAFAMTEPARRLVGCHQHRERASSVMATTMSINGRKWWISGMGDAECELMILHGQDRSFRTPAPASSR